MSKQNKPDNSEDITFFRAAMQNVKPLVHTKISQPPPNRRPRKKIPQIREEPQTLPFSDHETLPPAEWDDKLEFARSGVQHKILRKMRQGQYNVDAILDLHGKNTEQAREALSRFLLQCQHDAVRQVLIIHGKGHTGKIPILKNRLNHWLRQTERVLAFCTTPPGKGGSGALYVLLRR